MDASESRSELELLKRGELVLLPTDAGLVVAADLFNEAAVSRVRQEAEQGSAIALPVILLASVDHIEAMAAELSADAWILIRRFLPGPLALAVRPTGLAPKAARIENDLIAVSVPLRKETVDLIAEYGRPLLSIPNPAADSPGLKAIVAETGAESGPTAILDVTQRPARVLREGAPTREELARFILMEEQ